MNYVVFLQLFDTVTNSQILSQVNPPPKKKTILIFQTEESLCSTLSHIIKQVCTFNIPKKRAQIAYLKVQPFHVTDT